MPVISLSRIGSTSGLLVQFGAAILERGRKYDAEGRVEVRRVKQTDDELHVEAAVKAEVIPGEKAQFYVVDAWLPAVDSDEAVGVDNVCTCELGGDCAHAVAVLMMLMRDNEGEPKEVTPFGLVPVAPEPYPEPSTEALGWLGKFDTDPAQNLVPNKVAKKNQQRLVYLLRPEAPMSMALGKSRPLQGGGFGKPLAYRPQSYDLVGSRGPGHFLAEDDLLPLRLFLALQAGGSYYFNESVELTGEAGALLFRQALSTGRLYLNGHMESPLLAGDPQPLDLVWTRNSTGLQQLAFDVPLAHQVIATWPLFYLDSETRRVGELRSPLPDRLLKQLMSAPPLNEADAPLVRSRLSRLAVEQQVAIPLPEASEALSLGRPSARLVLTQGRFRYAAVSSLYDEYAMAVLYLDYPHGLTVTGAEQPSPMVRHRVDGEWLTYQRDLAVEAEIWRFLQDVGLESFRRRLSNYLRVGTDGSAGDCAMPARLDASGWLPLLNGGISLLEANGVIVHVADDFPFRLAQADDWFVAVEEEVGNDWFSLDLGVMMDGERVSLVPPLLRLLREQPRFLSMVRSLDDKLTYPVALDARRILPVPVVRLKAWLLPLLEFLDDDRPRLSRHHAAALAGLEDQACEWIGGEELRRLGQRLRDFSGVDSQPPAPGFMATLRPYQQHGLDWLQFLREYGLAGILADDMGLGKTVQTLAHLHFEKVSGRADRPSLVVATTSLMSNWRNEAAQFTPSLRVLTLHGKDRAALFDEMDKADIILTTYPLLVRDRDTLLARDYHLLVMDEAQFIKNPKAQSHQVARLIKARHRLSLTGTPLENHLGELWAQYDFLMPGLLGTAKRFGQMFRTPIEKQGDSEMRVRLAERVRPFLLRRTKEQVLKDLPPRTEMVRWVELEGGQRDLYESLRVVFDKKLRQVLTEQGIGRSQIMILDALLKLRQVCCDPRLVNLPAAEAMVKKGGASSAKLIALMDMLEDLLDEGRKVLLFSQFTSMLALIEKELEARACKYVKLTGQTRDRETPIREFQEGNASLFLISLKAGGTGLNLTAADTVIHYDPWWNPAVEEQATARAHRIGQDKPVFVYKLMTQGTVEEKILALQDRKRGLADQLMRKPAAGVVDEGGGHLITAEDLDVLFQPLSM